MTSYLTGLLADARHRPAQNSQKKAVSKERLPDLGRRYEKLSFFISILFLSGNFSFSLVFELKTHTNRGEEIGFIPIFVSVTKYEFGGIVICICISFPNY